MIEARKRLTAKVLLEVKERYKELFLYSLDLIFLVDLKGVLQDLNDLALRTLGYEKKSILNKPFNDLLDKNEEYEVDVESIGKRDEGYNYNELKFIKKDGNIIFTHIYTIPIIKNDKIVVYLYIAKDIPAYKEKDEESFQNYKIVLEQSMVGIITINNGKFQYINDEVVNIFEYPAEEILNWTIDNLIKKFHKDDQKIFIKQLDQRLSGKEISMSFQLLRIVTKYHAHKWLEIYTNSLNQKKNDEILITIKDISDELKVEQDIIESQLNYKLITENLNEMVIVMDQNNEVEYINRATANGLGDPSSLASFNFDMIVKDDIEKMIEFFQKVRQQFTYEDELSLLKKDGNEIWVGGKGKTFLGVQGESKVISIFRDITKNKLAEQKLKGFMETAPDCFAIWDSELNLIEINNAGTAFFGNQSKKSLLGKNLFDLMPRFKGTIEFNEYLKILKTGKQLFEEDILIDPIGKFYINQRIFKLGNELGMIISDITNQKIAEDQIKEANKRLQELDELRKNFLEQAAHELRTPLIPICGYSELFIDNNNKIIKILEKISIYMDLFSIKDIDIKILNDSISKIKPLYKQMKEDLVSLSEDFDYFKAGADKLRALAERLLNFSRIEGNKLDLIIEDVNVHKILKDCISIINPESTKRKINIFYNNDEDVYMKLDEISIFQVFQNLISNAIKNTFTGGEVAVSIKKSDTTVLVSVKDTGIGLTKEEVNNIFSKFGQLKREGDIITKGWGIGLYSSMKIVEQHYGKIWVDSQGRNKGANFFVELPIKN